MFLMGRNSNTCVVYVVVLVVIKILVFYFFKVFFKIKWTAIKFTTFWHFMCFYVNIPFLNDTTIVDLAKFLWPLSG